MSDALWSRIDEYEASIVRRYINSYPVKVGELAKELGIEVFRSPLPPRISGLIQPKPGAPGVYEIKVNKFESEERQRFTLAHEIAHFLLHKAEIKSGVVDSIMYRSALTSKKEAEANRLAADIVMPERAVQKELQIAGGEPSEDIANRLAAIFKVSSPAMKIRIGA